MARRLRLEYPGTLPHLTARGNDQQVIVHAKTDWTGFLTGLGHETLRQGWCSPQSSNDHTSFDYSVVSN